MATQKVKQRNVSHRRHIFRLPAVSSLQLVVQFVLEVVGILLFQFDTLQGVVHQACSIDLYTCMHACMCYIFPYKNMFTLNVMICVTIIGVFYFITDLYLTSMTELSFSYTGFAGGEDESDQSSNMISLVWLRVTRRCLFQES